MSFVSFPRAPLLSERTRNRLAVEFVPCTLLTPRLTARIPWRKERKRGCNQGGGRKCTALSAVHGGPSIPRREHSNPIKPCCCPGWWRVAAFENQSPGPVLELEGGLGNWETAPARLDSCRGDDLLIPLSQAGGARPRRAMRRARKA
jgi:hypothetical protein